MSFPEAPHENSRHADLSHAIARQHEVISNAGLARLLADPTRALELRPIEAAALLAQVAGLEAVLRVAAGVKSEPPDERDDDGMIKTADAARIAGLTVAEFYRRKVFRPACIKAGHRTLRVNERKLRRILAGLGS